MRSVIRVMLMLAVIPGLSLGQTRGGSEEERLRSWENIGRLRAGQKIEVVDTSLRSFKGTYLDSSGEAISLRVGKDSVTVRRPDVMRVSLRGNSNRLRNGLLGIGIGAGVGFAASEIWTRRSQPNPAYRDEYRSISRAVLVPIGMGVGALAFLPSSHDYRTVYRAK